MRPNRVLPKILLIVGFSILFLIIKYQDSIKDFASFNLEKMKIHFDNFFSEEDSRITRHRPFSLLEKETELKLYIGEPFKSFTREDFNEFWHLIYGTFPKDIPDREGLPRKTRQLTSDEIAFELMSLYPQPFAYFKSEHWQTFFDIVLKK